MTATEFTEADRTEALAILDRFQQIVDNEALVRGLYVTPVVAPARIDKACGGRNACAIGSLWLAAGVAPVFRDGTWDLPGTVRGRAKFLEDQSASLRLAYGVLNEAAQFYAVQSDIHWSEDEDENGAEPYEDDLENLFERGRRDGDLIDPSELTQVIAIARDRITDMALAS
jgi:hypothetical protein